MKRVFIWVWYRLYPPTRAQRKAAGQVMLSFGAASAISLVTIVFGSPEGGNWYNDYQKIVALVFSGVVCFVTMLQYIDIPSVVLVLLTLGVGALGLAYARAEVVDEDQRDKPD